MGTFPQGGNIPNKTFFSFSLWTRSWFRSTRPRRSERGLTWDQFEGALRGEGTLPPGLHVMWPARDARIASIEAIDVLLAESAKQDSGRPMLTSTTSGLGFVTAPDDQSHEQASRAAPAAELAADGRLDCRWKISYNGGG